MSSQGSQPTKIIKLSSESIEDKATLKEDDIVSFAKSLLNFDPKLANDSNRVLSCHVARLDDFKQGPILQVDTQPRAKQQGVVFRFINPQE